MDEIGCLNGGTGADDGIADCDDGDDDGFGAGCVGDVNGILVCCVCVCCVSCSDTCRDVVCGVLM